MSALNPSDLRVQSANGAVQLSLGDTSVSLSPDETLELSRQLTESLLQLEATAEPDSEASEQMRVPMQLLVLAAERDPDAEGPKDEDAADRALIYCWIKGQTRMNAIHIAVGSVNETDWIVTDLKEHQAVKREDFAGDDFEQYFDQALTDEEVFLYLVGDTEEDEDDDKN
jgi:hypothetical protein